MLKVGLVGYGGLGHVHAAGVWQAEGVELVAVCDIDPQKLVAKDVAINLETAESEFDISACNTYLDFKDMLKAEDLDIVIVTLPTDLHAEYSIMALESGCHVFCEKPMALNSSDCQKMIDAASKAKRQLMIAQCIRFWPEYEFLEECINDNRYGELKSLVMERVGEYPYWSDWFMDSKRSGGAIMDLHVHDVDWARYIFGEPERIGVAGSIGRSGGVDDAHLLMQNKNTSVSIRGSWMLKGIFQMKWEACFDKTYISYNPQDKPGITIRTEGQAEPEFVETSSKSAYLTELEYFIGLAEGKYLNTKCTPESSMLGIKLVEEEISVIKGK